MNHRPFTADQADLAVIQGRLAETRGPQFWRSLEELSGSEAFQTYLHREFPEQASEWTDPVGRRQFLQLMGASLALAGVSGCAFQPPETIVPYVRAPEDVVSGKPLFFTSALTLGGYASGVLVESWQGRPTKIEGNPAHPANLGGTDGFLQAAVLSLYDPDRSQVATRNGRVSSWDDFLGVLIGIRDTHKADKGAGLRILSEVIISPTFAAQAKALLAEFPEARWYQYDPVGRDTALAGAKLAFGEYVDPIHHFDKADVVVSLDADFMTVGPARLRDARQFASRREPEAPGGMNRLYVVEPTPSCTGSLADHRHRLSHGEVGQFARALAAAIGVAGLEAPSGMRGEIATLVSAVAEDLKGHRGKGLVVAGLSQPGEVHALAYAMNQALGNVGQTIEFIASVESDPGDRIGRLRELAADLNAGKVATLAILGGNPAYDAPVDFDFAKAIAKARFSVRLGLNEDETSACTQWHIPMADPLETWGDVRAFDGTATIQQPLIAALYGGKSSIEFLAALASGEDRDGFTLIKESWRTQRPDGDFEAFWRKSLRAGLVEGTASKPKSVEVKSLAGLPPATIGTSGGLEVIFLPDPNIWDGQFANNGWLQELPKAMTKLCWDNVALISKATADRLKLVVDGFHVKADHVELELSGKKVKAPIWINPGQADDVITIHLGAGRTRSGRVGTGVGFDAYQLRTSSAPWTAGGLTIKRLGTSFQLASVQSHNNMEGRDLIRVGAVEEYKAKPDLFTEHDHHLPHGASSLYDVPLPQLTRDNGEGNRWGMSINLNICHGCNACTIACQAENNIPVVGKDQVTRGREMHWLRIDRYYEGSPENPGIHHQPVPCMHCESAPCEIVCPVAATTHSAEGLNEMTYNRCVGTRYCSNNCPYKVRRFNFLDYNDETTPVLTLLRNPDVTVRKLGVMEKCTYCVQRISAARIAAEGENRRVGGNEVVTACQSACPTNAIVFGNLNDPAADVVKRKADKRNYALLGELNTRPRTTYLAKLTNTNPALKEG